jgi:hypothetical protein
MPGPNCWSTAQTVTMTGVEDVNETTETVADYSNSASDNSSVIST